MAAPLVFSLTRSPFSNAIFNPIPSMDGASGAQIARRAQDLVDTSVPSSSTRVTIAIDRDGRPAFRFAYRPATRKAAMWAAAGVDLPHVPPPVTVQGPDTPFSNVP